MFLKVQSEAKRIICKIRKATRYRYNMDILLILFKMILLQLEL